MEVLFSSKNPVNRLSWLQMTDEESIDSVSLTEMENSETASYLDTNRQVDHCPRDIGQVSHLKADMQVSKQRQGKASVLQKLSF